MSHKATEAIDGTADKSAWPTIRASRTNAARRVSLRHGHVQRVIPERSIHLPKDHRQS
jgi:hypothetical protein